MICRRWRKIWHRGDRFFEKGECEGTVRRRIFAVHHDALEVGRQHRPSCNIQSVDVWIMDIDLLRLGSSCRRTIGIHRGGMDDNIFHL